MSSGCSNDSWTRAVAASGVRPPTPMPAMRTRGGSSSGGRVVVVVRVVVGVVTVVVVAVVVGTVVVAVVAVAVVPLVVVSATTAADIAPAAPNPSRKRTANPIRLTAKV